MGCRILLVLLQASRGCPPDLELAPTGPAFNHPYLLLALDRLDTR